MVCIQDKLCSYVTILLKIKILEPKNRKIEGCMKNRVFACSVSP